MPFTLSVTPVCWVPETIKPMFSVLLTRTSVPELGSGVSTTCPGPTFTCSVAELAEPGFGLVTSSGKVPGSGAGIAATSCVSESNVVGTTIPFQLIWAP